MASKLNRKQVRDYILAECARTRPQLRMRRVSASTFAYLEKALEWKIDKLIASHPSLGVTFTAQVIHDERS